MINEPKEAKPKTKIFENKLTPEKDYIDLSTEMKVVLLEFSRY